MSKIETSIEINRPVEDVFTYITTFDNNHFWQGAFISYEQLEGNGPEVGARYRNVNRFLGLKIESESLITEIVPGSHCRFELSSRFIAGNSVLLFESLGSGTRVTVTGEIQFPFFKLTGKRALKKFKKQLETDLHKLKNLLEAS